MKKSKKGKGNYEGNGENLTPEQAAKILCTSVGTLAFWRCRGGGPPFWKPGPGKVLYNRAALDAYREARMQQPRKRRAA